MLLFRSIKCINHEITTKLLKALVMDRNYHKIVVLKYYMYTSIHTNNNIKRTGILPMQTTHNVCTL